LGFEPGGKTAPAAAHRAEFDLCLTGAQTISSMPDLVESAREEPAFDTSSVKSNVLSV